MFSSMMSIKHAFDYQKSRFSFRKNGYNSDKKPLSPKANSFDKHWFKKKQKKLMELLLF